MNRMFTQLAFLIMAMLTVFTASCSHVVHKVDVLYSPLSKYKGGTGTLDLVRVDSVSHGSTGPSIRWVVGQIKNSEGEATGDIISTIRPQDVVADAFMQELATAGYQVRSTKKLDKSSEKGIIFTSMSVQLDEVPSLTRLESSCSILVKMDLWKGGTIVKRLEYSSKLSDVAVLDRELLPNSLFQKAIQQIMHQALPDIIQNLN